MHLLYCDESNLEERSGDFFVYAGVIIDAAASRDLSDRIDKIRTGAKVPTDYRLKFKPGPDCLNNQQFNDLKKLVVAAAVEAKVHLFASVILHDIATSPERARLYGINVLSLHFDRFLKLVSGTGLVLIDRFGGTQADAHLVEKFSIGVTGLPYTLRLRLSNIVGFHYSAVGQSHFASLIDVVIGSLRFAINAFTRDEESNIDAARRILEGLQPLFFREKENAPLSEFSFCFSPKTVASERFRAQYFALKDFLAQNGVDTAQAIRSN